MANSIPLLYIVMPCFNEEAGIRETIKTVSVKITELIEQHLIAEGSAMLFADDGSKDSTWQLIAEAHQTNALVKAVKLAGNRGKEYALWAGVMEARLYADVVVCMDADLQFDINAIADFLRLHAEGYELIYGIKTNRGKERWYKKIASHLFYTLMEKLGSPILHNHTDYCLLTRQVCEALSEYGETNVIFRGLVKSLGFRQTHCYFNVLNREHGESHFSARKLLNLSLDAITSFSVTPLRFIGGVGTAVFCVGIAMIIWTICDALRGVTPDGYATLNCTLWFLGGLNMLCLSIVGEYIGKMYMEQKKRPRYYISSRLL